MQRRAKKQTGLVTVVATMAMLLLLAMTGFALDTGNAFSQYRDAQTAADSAALAGAFEKFYGNDSDINSSASTAASTHGFVNGVDGVTVTINNPPTSGLYSGDDFSVEVIITHEVGTSFLSVIGFDELEYSVRATANSNTANSLNCVYVLAPNKEKALEVSSSSELITNCGVFVNSSDSKGLSVTSGADIEGTTITVVGGSEGSSSNYECTGSSECPIEGQGAPASEKPIPAPDPFSGLTPPSVTYTAASCAPEESCNASGCSGKEKDSGGPYEPYTVESNRTLNPGVYCGGLFIKDGTTTLNPGVYILRGGGLVVDGSSSTLKGEDVSFYNTCFWECDDSNSDHSPDNGPEWYWPLDIKSGATVELSAPACDGGSSGKECENDLDGVLFFSDRLAPESDDPGSDPVNRIDSDADAILNGAVYAWNQHLKFHSGSSGSSSKSILVSKFLEVSSGSDVEIDNFTGSSDSSPLKRVTLVE
ncbi:pilus assembly protein TadG-related protein [Vibrio paucivorans]